MLLVVSTELTTTVTIVLSFPSLMALLSYTGNYESKQHAAAVVDNTEPFANNNKNDCGS